MPVGSQPDHIVDQGADQGMTQAGMDGVQMRQALGGIHPFVLREPGAQGARLRRPGLERAAATGAGREHRQARLERSLISSPRLDETCNSAIEVVERRGWQRGTNLLQATTDSR